MENSTSISNDITGNDREKFLDGLLVSGFDESSCISRSQSHFYHKPSPYLLSKLGKYEENHRKCGPNTRAFNEDMKIIAKYKENGTDCAAKTTCKYIILLPANGLGNQIITAASSFLYAMLTDRVILGKTKKVYFVNHF